jgi:L-iditol 2-dehydrogenase
MRAARLHGLRDLRIENIPEPSPGAGDLLVRVEACGVCPTDVRKYLIGVNDGEYPFNPGHEWIGRIEQVGPGVTGWEIGQRVYGDTYAGYAELALISATPGAWSHGPLALPDDLSPERAIFVEPFADCLHAVRDQARAVAGSHVVVVGGGQMGLQLVVAARLADSTVTLVEPLEERRVIALELGADRCLADLSEVDGQADAVILSIGVGGLVGPAIEHAAAGGIVVLFAGFGDAPRAEIDLNLLHYREISVVGSEWIGTPPNQRRERYAEARDLLASGEAPLERLVTGQCDLDGLEAVFGDVQALRGLKTVLVP